MQFKLKNNLKFGHLREQLQSINKIPLNRIKQGLNDPKTPSNDVICYEGAANYVALFHKDGKDCDYVLGGGYGNILHAWAECDGKKYETRKPLNMKEEYVEYIRINIPKDLPIDDVVNKVVSTIKEKVDNKCLSEMYRGDKMKFTKPLDLDEALGLKKEKALKEGNDPYHNHIQYKVTLKDEDGTYVEIFEVPEYVAIQDKKFDAKEYFKDFYKLKDDEIVKVEKVGYYTDSTNVNPFKYEESLEESINTSKKPLKKALFTIEDEINVEGYDEDYSWNGWACPWFTKENADKIATWSSIPLEYDAKRDAYIEKDSDIGETAYVGEHIDTEDGTLLLYPIGNKSWVWSIVEKPMVENKKKVCESLDDREEHFTEEEQEDYGIDENGYELDGFDRYIHCDWCGEPTLEDETRKEINLGYLCRNCVDALISRGEKPVFDDYGAFDEDLGGLKEDWEFNVYSREGGIEKIIAKDDKTAKREYQKKHPTVALPFISIKTFGKVNETLNEDASNKDWTKIFEDALDTMEFTLVKYPDGWGLLDRQGGNLGDIEADRFENADQIVDRLDAYWNDYYFESIGEGVDEEDYPESGLDTAEDILTWYTPEMQKKYPDIESDIDVIELVAEHSGDIDLEKVYHENGNEDTVGTAVYEIHFNNDEKKDGRMYVQGKIYAVRCSETLAQKLADTMTKETAHFGGKNTFSIARVPYALSNEYFIQEKEDVEDEIADLEFRMQDENYVDESLGENSKYAPLSEREPYKVFVPGDHVKYVNNDGWTDSGKDNIGRTGVIIDSHTVGATETFMIKADDHREIMGYDDDSFLAHPENLEFYNLDESKKSIKDDTKKIKQYSWALNDNGDLDIFIIDDEGEQILATISDCADKSEEELDALAQEIIEEDGYVFEKLIQGKSDATLKKNIATEIKAGKDPKQAYAIAKSVQRKNMK